MIDHPCDNNRVQQLEKELEEMTIVLTQAWDQLVPFLQEVPTQAETVQNIEPILHTVAAAAAADLAGVYLYKADEWYCIPESINLSRDAIQRLSDIRDEQIIELEAHTGIPVKWAFAPVISESERIGVLGIGTYDSYHTFSAVDLRIVRRMAERIGGQITASQLALLREREVVQARDMQIANEIQQSIQPANSPQLPGVQMATYWNPAREVGGDAWGWLETNASRLMWFILDVAGKGLPAALAAVALHTAIIMALRMRLSPVDALRAVNSQFYDAFTRTDLMATVAILSLDTTTGMLELANAGHPPILVRHDNNWLRIEATAPPVGVLPSLQAEAQFLRLKPRDLIIAYSDGFTEIETQSGLWGQTGLLNTISTSFSEVESITLHIVDASQRVGLIEDDQTLITTLFTGS